MKTEIERLQVEHAMVVADLKLRLQIAERQHKAQCEIAILVTRELEEANTKLQKAIDDKATEKVEENSAAK